MKHIKLYKESLSTTDIILNIVLDTLVDEKVKVSNYNDGNTLFITLESESHSKNMVAVSIDGDLELKELIDFIDTKTSIEIKEQERISKLTKSVIYRLCKSGFKIIDFTYNRRSYYSFGVKIK